MSAPLTYLPAYLGLYASLLLAVVCNAFLDIQYGIFGVEVFLWVAAYAWTLAVGWKQQGQADSRGAQAQKMALILGAAVSFLLFIPLWGFPRAGLYMLAALQASLNCVTTTRRHLHFGLLVSVVMVMFAASHHRADWTMLFYLIPYIVAVVFTLVSEQISRRARDVRQASLGDPGHAGQGAAIAAATAMILGIGGALYLATPQVTWPYLQWRYGQLNNIGFVGEAEQEGPAGKSGQSGQGSGGQDQGQGQGAGSGSGGQPEDGQGLSPGRGWPTPGEMREAARRPGMPEWQSAAIMQMASLDEAIREALAPILDALKELWNSLKEWLKENRLAAWLLFVALLFLAILIVLGLLLREARALAWLATRFDYLRLGILGRHRPGTAGAGQYYRAMERLFDLRETPRPPNANPREFLKGMTYYRDDIRRETTEFTHLFERCRYGPEEADEAALDRLRALYRTVFGKLH